MAKENLKEDINSQVHTNASSKIDAIKHLIFGENMQAYDHEFEVLKKDLETKKQQLEELMVSIKDELLQNIDNLSTDINIRITELESSTQEKLDVIESNKVDRKLLGDLLVNLGEKISK